MKNTAITATFEIIAIFTHARTGLKSDLTSTIVNAVDEQSARISFIRRAAIDGFYVKIALAAAK